MHTDLKLDNVLLVNDSFCTFAHHKTIPSCFKSTKRTVPQTRVLLQSEIRLIDFGLAMFNYNLRPSTVSTRPYRAPEIIMKLGWSYPCDIWSIGCILVELFTGDMLFKASNDMEHLAAIQTFTCQRIDPGLARMAEGRGTEASRYVFIVLGGSAI